MKGGRTTRVKNNENVTFGTAKCVHNVEVVAKQGGRTTQVPLHIHSNSKCQIIGNLIYFSTPMVDDGFGLMTWLYFKTAGRTLYKKETPTCLQSLFLCSFEEHEITAPNIHEYYNKFFI